MNNTTKAKYLMAQKMFLGHIDIEEVALMTGLSMEELKVIQEENTPDDTATIQHLDNLDIDFGPILRDNYSTSDFFDSDENLNNL